MQHRAGVQVAGARPHDETLERGHAHARFDAAACFHGAHARAVSEVAGDEAQVAKVFVEVLGRLGRDVRVARAVKTVAANLMLLGELRGERVGPRAAGEGGVKGRVEDRHVRELGQQFTGRANSGEVRWIVERGQVEERFDRRASDEHFDAWPVSSLLERMKAERDDAPLILPKLEHEDRFVRGVAAQRLAEIATIEIAERLTRMLDSDDDWTEERLLTGAAHGADRGSIDDEALRLLIEAVTAECRRREYVDGHLATFLLRVDRPQAVDVLTELLSPSTRSFSSILGALNDANVALPHERLEAWHTELRSRVVEPRDQWLVHSDIGAVILAHVVAGHPDGPALVEVALDDDGRDVRAYAIEAHKQLLGLNGLSFYDALSSREKAGTLNWQQRAWWDITSLQGQVSNGGFVQYYYNLYGRRANETHRALVEIGALRAAELLADSIAQFGPAGPSKNGAELEEQLAGLSQEAMQRLDDLDSAFYEDEDHLDTRLHLYTLEHRAHFWDLAEPETA